MKQDLMMALSRVHQQLVDKAQHYGIATIMEMTVPQGAVNTLREQGVIDGDRVVLNGAAVRIVGYTNTNDICLFPAVQK
jgi:hypothetical protein